MYEIVYKDVQENEKYEKIVKKVLEQCFKEEAAGCPIYEDDNARTAFETALKDREYENLLCLGSLYLAGEIKDFATTIF